MLKDSYRRFLINPLILTTAAMMLQPAIAGNLATKASDTVKQKYGEAPIEVLAADKPDAVILRGGPVPNDLANEISLTVAKVDGVNELINEIVIE